MDFLNPYQPYKIGVFRIVTGLIFMEHGTQNSLAFRPKRSEECPSFSPYRESAVSWNLSVGSWWLSGCSLGLWRFLSGEMETNRYALADAATSASDKRSLAC
jgi:hypothetical protein